MAFSFRQLVLGCKCVKNLRNSRRWVIGSRIDNHLTILTNWRELSEVQGKKPSLLIITNLFISFYLLKDGLWCETLEKDWYYMIFLVLAISSWEFNLILDYTNCTVFTLLILSYLFFFDTCTVMASYLYGSGVILIW